MQYTLTYSKWGLKNYTGDLFNLCNFSRVHE